MLSLAGANPRDYAVLQVFLQTGIRVSELANLKTEDIDFIKPSITVRGKGSVEREIALEKKGVHALRSYLLVRGVESVSQRVFLNYQGEPISERGIRKLVVKYRKEAGITKKASCHTLRNASTYCYTSWIRIDFTCLRPALRAQAKWDFSLPQALTPHPCRRARPVCTACTAVRTAARSKSAR